MLRSMLSSVARAEEESRILIHLSEESRGQSSGREYGGAWITAKWFADRRFKVAASPLPAQRPSSARVRRFEFGLHIT